MSEAIEEAVELVSNTIDEASGPDAMSQEEAREFLEQIMADCRTKIDGLTTDIGDEDSYRAYRF